jgi:multidrug efflux pump subunit AcrA (membrane-fusion protein)
MKRLLLSLATSAALLGQSSLFAQAPTDAAAAKAPTLGELTLGFDIDRVELLAPLTELDKLYLGQLEKLGQQSQDRGALEEVIAVRAEQARIKGQAAEAKGTDFPDLVKIRAIYEKSKAERTALMHQQLLPVIERHKGQLEALRTAQTQQNLLEDAIRTNEELTKIAALEKQVSEAQDKPVPGALSPALPPVGTGANVLKVKVQVDGKSRLVLKDGKVWFDHTNGRASPPGRHEGEFPTYLNDKTEWKPVWTGSVTEPFAADFAFPADPPAKIKLRMADGRGIAEVIQQPTPENAHTAIVELRDEKKDGGVFFGSDWMEFRLSW